MDKLLHLFVLDFWKPLAKLKGHKCSLHKLEKFFFPSNFMIVMDFLQELE